MPSNAYESGVVPQSSLLHSVLDNLLEGFHVIDDELRYVYVNRAFEEQSGRPSVELLGRSVLECFPQAEGTEGFRLLKRCLETKTSASETLSFEFLETSKRWFEIRYAPVPEGVAVLTIDITERKRTEESLIATMRAFSTLSECNRHLVRATCLDEFLDAICATLVEQGKYEASAIFERIESHGEDELKLRAECGKLGRTPEALLRQMTLDLPGKTEPGVLKLQMKPGTTVTAEERRLLEQVCIDVGYGMETLTAREEHERTQEQLAAARRMEAIGRLAGGVAHDFNNLLTVILAYSRLAADRLLEDDPTREDLEQIFGAGEQAAALTRQLLTFSRKQVLEPKPTNLNQIVSSLQPMLRRILGEDINVNVTLDDNLGTVLVDKGHVEQVVMNLAVNARDAMPEGGNLTITTRNSVVSDSSDEKKAAGKYVELLVEDSGIGMTDEVQSQVFEPFFTTKTAEKGTGLGLATVYGIVKQSGGYIAVESKVGSGSTFTLSFPCLELPLPDSSAPESIVPSRGNETILLVENNVAVRMATRRVLESAGYRVLAAASAEAARTLFDRCGRRVDLLLTDSILCDQKGEHLARTLQSLEPRIKVLVVSGTEGEDQGAESVRAHTFLNKPFSGAGLTARIRKVLSERSPA